MDGFCKKLVHFFVSFKKLSYLCKRFGEKSGLIESICYYFALSQNAQETVWK